ncbi:unnamed protein product [Ectocarpus sp. CCAP 1310/34]|nr:unnamed protein product [Ectocarpus sp. CCAP 1310/34]
MLSDYSCILKPHGKGRFEIARHMDGLSGDSCILKPHWLSDVGVPDT